MKIKHAFTFAALLALSLSLALTNVNAATNSTASISTITNSSNVTIAPGTGAAGPNGTCVTQNNCFNPHMVNITKGQNVTWNNTDSVVHTVVSGKQPSANAGKLFDKIIPAGKSISIMFNQTGTINYFCKIHPWMKGEVVVKNVHSLHKTTKNLHALENMTNSSENKATNSTVKTTNATNSSSTNSSSVNDTIADNLAKNKTK